MKTVIGVDLDGVIYDFVSSFNIKYNCHATSKGERTVDTEFQPYKYDFFTLPEYHTECAYTVWHNRQYELMRDALVYSGAFYFMYDLAKFDAEIFFITHQSTDKAREGKSYRYYTDQLYKYGSLLFIDGNEKYQYCDILIDDCADNCNICADNGVLTFCIDREWNKGLFPIHGNYSDCIKYIKSALFV